VARVKLWGPSDLAKVGYLHLTRHETVDGPELHIDRADPIILVHTSVLNEMQHSTGSFARVDGEILTVTGKNRTVVYRIGEYDPAQDAYVCRWPD
jgi:hypothetical protein